MRFVNDPASLDVKKSLRTAWQELRDIEAIEHPTAADRLRLQVAKQTVQELLHPKLFPEPQS